MQVKAVYIVSLVFCVFAETVCFATDSLPAIQQLDTLEVIGRVKQHSAGPTIFTVSPEQNYFSGHDNVEQLLESSSPVWINSYGPGNASSISIRGANDDHTTVYWNGLKLNSLTLGGTDLSIIPPEAGTEINVNTGGTAFGGSIEMNTRPDWNNRFQLRLQSDFGTYRHFRNCIGFAGGNRRFQFHSNTFVIHGLDNFSYTDPYKFNAPRDTAFHNAIKEYGTLNEAFLQLKHQQYLSFGSWFQWKDKDIPAIMGSYEDSQKFQHDMSLRHYLQWEKYSEHIIFHLNAGHSYDVQHYIDKKLPTDTFLLINSDYHTHRIEQSFYILNTFKHGLSLTSGYDYNLMLAKVKEYTRFAHDQTGEACSKLNLVSGDLQTSLRIAQPFSSYRYLRPQFYADAGYTTTNKRYAILFSYSDKYRFPDLNDRYWNPGGNPALKPETGWSVNLGNTLQWKPETSSPHQLKAQWNLYYSRIENIIVWTPVTNILWTPRNLKSSRLYGSEFLLSYTFTAREGFRFLARAMYLYNRAQILKDENNPALSGHLLPYKPQHVLRTEFRFEDRNFSAGIHYNYVSLRYTDEENFTYFALKPYHLLDMFVSFKAALKGHQLQVLFKVNNLSDVSYESVRAYAQPGRNYVFSLIYDFQQKQTP